MLTMPKRIEPAPGQESVWDYPRPPRLESTERHIRIEAANIMLADSVRAKRVLETSHPPVYYLPPVDIKMEFLRPAIGKNWCEWKGSASYYDLVIDDRLIERVAWSYADPTESFQSIQGYLAFYPSKMDRCSVNGEIVDVQPGDFYGGWITSEIVGPFKGSPGTMGW